MHREEEEEAVIHYFLQWTDMKGYILKDPVTSFSLHTEYQWFHTRDVLPS